MLTSVDALVTPSSPVPAQPIGFTSIKVKDKELSATSGMGSLFVRNTMPANQAGVPAISIPAGCTSDGLPVGIQLITGAFLDYKLLSIATLVEEMIGFDPTPPILKAMEAAA